MNTIEEQKEVHYDANEGDVIGVPGFGAYTVRRVTRNGVLFKERLGKVSYYYLELVGATYLQRKK